MNQACTKPSGANVLLHWYTPGTDPQVKPWEGQPHISYGMEKSQMCPTSESGDVWPMYTQKDKWLSLSLHMEKFTFIGYPEGIKGWKFIIPKLNAP